MRIRPKKALGQHFLTAPHYCKKLVEFSGVRPGETVLEVGPGTGRLTRELLEAGCRVIAVEVDPSLVRHLERTLSATFGERLLLIEEDILRLDLRRLPGSAPLEIVGNLPYNIAAQVLTKTIESIDRFQGLTFMVQKEVAERILAEPGDRDFGSLSLLAAYHFRRTAGFDVPPGAFHPPPKVVSHVLGLRPRSPLLDAEAYRRFRSLIRLAFRHRRKTLLNNLKAAGLFSSTLQRTLREAGVPPGARPQEVTLESYLCLARML